MTSVGGGGGVLSYGLVTSVGGGLSYGLVTRVWGVRGCGGLMLYLPCEQCNRRGGCVLVLGGGGYSLYLVTVTALGHFQ